MKEERIFRRYELKYLIDRETKAELLAALGESILPDRHGRSTVRSLYYDTADYRMIRRSIEKPIYKEKLRLRCYSDITDSSEVFCEIKKKYKGVVYKRRISLPYHDATLWLVGDGRSDSQIAREIDTTKNLLGGVRPAALITYDREAFYDRLDENVRITFDTDIRAGLNNLSLTEPCAPYSLIGEGLCLMELKCLGGLPLYIVRLLSERRIYKTSFSKYGRAYSEYIFPYLYGKDKGVKTNERDFQGTF